MAMGAVELITSTFKHRNHIASDNIASISIKPELYSRILLLFEVLFHL